MWDLSRGSEGDFRECDELIVEKNEVIFCEYFSKFNLFNNLFRVVEDWEKFLDMK